MGKRIGLALLVLLAAIPGMGLGSSCPGGFTFAVQMGSFTLDTNKGILPGQAKGVRGEIAERLNGVKGSACDSAVAKHILANDVIAANLTGIAGCNGAVDVQEWLKDNNITQDVDVTYFTPLKPSNEKPQESECLKSFIDRGAVTIDKLAFNIVVEANDVLTVLPAASLYMSTIDSKKMSADYPSGLDDDHVTKLTAAGQLYALGTSKELYPVVNGVIDVPINKEQAAKFTRSLLLREGTFVFDTASVSFVPDGKGNLLKPKGSAKISPPSVQITIKAGLSDLECAQQLFQAR